MKHIKPSFLQISILIVVVTHLVGMIGFVSPWQELFISLTPIHLLLSAGLLLANQEDKNKTFWFAVVGLMAAGYLIELIGIQTGVIFGEYSYDRALGPKIGGTPPIIGVNWMMLVVAVAALISRIKTPFVIKAMLGAMALVGIDYLIEPVAIAYDFWHWHQTTVPTHNYLGWLITAFIFFGVYLSVVKNKANPLALVLLLMQIVFFGVLNFTV
ncbi:MAG: carotenoid biosynthesis protein [Cryomorphaceae bacterium]|nr:MAG: carotenoid biosynthesis protein [Cryomorphaceae bacterium]